MKNKNKYVWVKSLAIWLSLILILGVGGGWFLIREISSAKDKLQLAYENYYTTLYQLESFNTLKEDHSSLMERKGRLEGMVVKKDNSLELIRDLEKAAVAAGVELTTSVAEKERSKKKDEEKKPSENEVRLKLIAKGDFESILRFIRYVEYGEKIMYLKSIKIDQLARLNFEEEEENESEHSLGDLKAEIIISNIY